MKTYLIATLSLLSIALSFGAVHAQDGHGSVKVSYPQAEQPIWKRSTQYEAGYPRRLAMNGVTGCAVYDLEFNEGGEIENKSRVAASSGRHLTRETEQLIDSWDWRAADPEAPQAGEVQVRVDYCMARGTQEEVIAQCERQVQQSCS